MSLLLIGLQRLLGGEKYRQPASESSRPSRINDGEQISRVSTTRGQMCLNASIVAGNRLAIACSTPSTTASPQRQSVLGTSKHASALMISSSTYRPNLPPKIPVTKARPVKIAHACTKFRHFDIVLFRYGPRKEDLETFHIDFYMWKKIGLGLIPGTRDWEELYPGSPTYEKFWRAAIRSRPPVGGCIYCPFREEKDRDLTGVPWRGFIEDGTRSRNAYNRKDWEWRRWAAQRNGGEDLIPDWAEVIACDELHEKRKHDQLVAWGFLDEDEPASSSAAVLCEWLKILWPSLKEGASQGLKWIRSLFCNR